MKTTRRRFEHAIKGNREERMLNGRIGEREGRNWEEKRGVGKENPKTKGGNAERKRLMEWIEENGWELLNGNKQGDEEGKWTYIAGRGKQW
jgi:hypothetical protein